MKQLSNKVGRWHSGGRISVQSFGALDACPTSVDVVITLDGLPQAIKKKGLRISSRR